MGYRTPSPGIKIPGHLVHVQSGLYHSFFYGIIDKFSPGTPYENTHHIFLKHYSIEIYSYMVVCKICNVELKTEKSLPNHVSAIHNITTLDYYIQYENIVVPVCKCGKSCKIRKGLVFMKTCGEKKCIEKERQRKHTDETKLTLSIKRKKWLKENKEKHPWKSSSKFVSAPCEYLKNILVQEGLVFISEYQPLEDRFYSLDIAFIDKGIGIEVNGNQHYTNNKELKDYYRERKRHIEEKGWVIYDIHYTKVYDPLFVKELIQVIKGAEDVIDLTFIYHKVKKFTCECGNLKHRYSKTCRPCGQKKRRKVERPLLENLLNDIEIFGYCGTGRKYGVSDNAIRKWVKSYDK
jgi:hypothetical protein